MKLIRSGVEAETSIVSPQTIDWSAVSGLQVWSTRHIKCKRLTAPAGLDVSWIVAAGVRYAVAVVFEDGTWVWTDLTLKPDAAIATAHRLATEHDKPVQRSGRAADDLLRTRGY